MAAKNTTTKSEKLVAKLRTKPMTVSQIMHTCGFSSPNSVYGTVSRLRDEGHKITAKKSTRGTTQYAI